MSCPHCRSKQDSSFKDSTWGCGVRFDDPKYRTKACYKRELNAANQRIKQLEEAGDRMAKVIGPPGCEMWALTEEVDASYEAWTKAKEDEI